MPILEFEPSERLLAICEHALAAAEPREGFRDSGRGAGLILCADCHHGVYLKSNGTPPLIDEASREIMACAVGADPDLDPDWAEIVVEVLGGAGGGEWPVDWARIIRHQIRQRTGRIRILSTDDDLEMLYATGLGAPDTRKEPTR